MKSKTLDRAYGLGFDAYFDGGKSPWHRHHDRKRIELDGQWYEGYADGAVEARAEARHNRTLYAGSEKI